MKPGDIKNGVFLFLMKELNIKNGVDVVRCIDDAVLIVEDVPGVDNLFYFFVQTSEGIIKKVSSYQCIHPSELIGGKYRKKDFEIRIGSQEFRNLILVLKNNKK
jgi:hypothetical protein